MGFFPRKSKVHFNIATLKKNDISILTLDERWNRIFKMIPISKEVKKRQDHLNHLLGQEAALYQEKKSIEPEKRTHMNRIIALTEEVFEKNNDDAKEALSKSKQAIENLNARFAEVENELFLMKDKIRNANFKLLEETVRYVYTVMEKSKNEEKQIETEMDKLKKRLKELQVQRQNSTTDWEDIYMFFHTLLGADELTKLDQLFLKSEVKKNEGGQSKAHEDHGSAGDRKI